MAEHRSSRQILSLYHSQIQPCEFFSCLGQEHGTWIHGFSKPVSKQKAGIDSQETCTLEKKYAWLRVPAVKSHYQSRSQHEGRKINDRQRWLCDAVAETAPGLPLILLENQIEKVQPGQSSDNWQGRLQVHALGVSRRTRILEVIASQFVKLDQQMIEKGIYLLPQIDRQASSGFAFVRKFWHFYEVPGTF